MIPLLLADGEFTSAGRGSERQQRAHSDARPLLVVSSATVRKADAQFREQIDENGHQETFVFWRFRYVL
jgi:hypothetical protein